MATDKELEDFDRVLAENADVLNEVGDGESVVVFTPAGAKAELIARLDEPED